MLSDQEYDLLTAFVDGELNVRQRKAALRLLRRSAPARGLFRQLQRDSLLLRDMTREKLPADFSDRLLRIAGEQTVPRVAPRSVPAWRRLQRAVGVAAAAMLLLAVGSMVLLAFNKKNPQENDERVADRSSPVAAEDPLPPPSPPLTAEAMAAHFTIPNTDPKMEIARPKSVNASAAELQDVQRLTAGDVQSSLQKGKIHALRLDLPCKNCNMALQRIRSALSAGNINLVIEQVAEHRLKNAKLRTNYVVYLDDLTQDELSKFLERLGQEDRKAESTKKGGAVFHGLLVNPMDEATLRDFKELLGPYGKALHVKAVTGSASAPHRGKGSGQAQKRLGLALPYNPVRPQSRSPEIHEFLESRRPPRPDTLQVLLVLYGR